MKEEAQRKPTLPERRRELGLLGLGFEVFCESEREREWHCGVNMEAGEQFGQKARSRGKG